GESGVGRGAVIALPQTRPDRPGDIAVARADQPGSLKVLTAVNEDLLGNKTLARVEEIWYESPKDRRKIQGWLMKPPGFDSSKKHPLILEIHGGPFANYGDRFDIEKQGMAAGGYARPYTDPRGSTSRRRGR